MRKKLRCLYVSRFAPERTRTDPYAGLPWYLSERTRLTGLWGRPEYRPVGFRKNCERVVETDWNWRSRLKGVLAIARQIIFRQRPDVVICGVDECSLGIGLFAGKIARAPVFSIVEDPVFTGRYRPPVSWGREVERKIRTQVVRQFLRRCAGIFCFVEKEALGEFRLRGVRVYQMQNGASPEALAWVQDRPKHSSSSRDCIVGLVGAMGPAQGLEGLLEIFAEARKRVKGLRLRLIGPLEPGYGPQYQARIRELGLEPAVELTGWLPYTKMLEQLEACAMGVYCNPPAFWSRVAQPLKVCEYLALRKPTVAWDYPGVRRLLDGGRLGVLVRAGDKVSFADAVVQLSEPEARRSIEREIPAAVQGRSASDYWYGEALRIFNLYADRRRAARNAQST